MAELPKLLSAAQTSVQSVFSPNRQIRFELLGFDAMRLKYRITRNNTPVIEDSVLGIGIAALHDMMDGVDRMESRAIRRIGDFKLRETFATRGVH